MATTIISSIRLKPWLFLNMFFIMAPLLQLILFRSRKGFDLTPDAYCSSSGKNNTILKISWDNNDAFFV